MNDFIDIKMAYNEDKGYYDISFSNNGDIEYDNSFDTTMNCSILTDGRADKTEVNKIEKQRGTIVDLFTSKRNGSKVWLLEQARLNIDTKNRMKDYIKSSLDFLIEEGFCKNIIVTSSLTSQGIAVDISIERLNGVFDKYTYNAWENSLYKV